MILLQRSPIAPTLIRVPDAYQAFSTLLEFYDKQATQAGIEKQLSLESNQALKTLHILAITVLLVKMSPLEKMSPFMHML